MHEVNRRVVLAGRNIGVGLGDVKCFTSVMNMPVQMDKVAYRRTVCVIQETAEHVAEESMGDAAEEVKSMYQHDDNSIHNSAVSGYGTWMKRIYFLMWGCV